MTDLKEFGGTSIAHHHNGELLASTPYPAELEAVIGPRDVAEAKDAITNWPGYTPSPLHDLGELAQALGVAKISYKDESARFGLGSFKALGGAYAVQRLVQDKAVELGLEVKEAAKRVTVVTATDGNHGRSVAWGAQMLGCPCRIYMHAGVSDGRAKAVEAYGATVVRVDGNYDESVRQAAADADDNGWFVVSDTSYEGYVEPPRRVMSGYTVMTGEAIDQMSAGPRPSHVFIQGGVGGLAAAVCAHLWLEYGVDAPRVVIVEPDRADCLYQSAVNGKPTDVHITEETIMAGLSCGEVSQLGWKILSVGASDFLTMTDDLVAPAMRLLAEGTAGPVVVAGESAVAGLAGLIAAGQNEGLSDALGLDATSHVLVIGTEGATDPAIYEEIVGRPAEEIAA